MSIHTLVPDIYTRITTKDGWFSEELAKFMAAGVTNTLRRSLGERRPEPRLRLSQLGTRCPKALWHSIHTPDQAEPIQPWAEVKFAFGHMVEELALTLAKASEGHIVEGVQDELVVNDVKGHRDAVIDGCIVDVKSSSSRSMEKFRTRSLATDDPFGYLEQLDGYSLGALNDPLVRVKDKAYILAVDKQLGHMVLYEHQVRHDHIIKRIEYFKEVVARDTPPHCECGTRPYGKSGNIELDVRASYSAYKYCCFPHLRCFLYSGGPVYLTKVVREPDVNEVNRYGTIIQRH